MLKKFDYLLKYNGVNFTSFLNFIIKHNIKISDVCRENTREIFFRVSEKEYKKYLKCNPNFNISIVKIGGLKQIITTFLKRSGLVIGSLIVACVFAFHKGVVADIRIYGANYTNESIENAIKNYGVEVGKKCNFDSEELAQYILDNVQEISLASVKKQGNSILVNVVEKEEKDENNEPLYAPYNMVIKDIDVLSGTLNVEKNSIVKKGDVLVESYIISSNGERISVPAKANIVADVWFCGSEVAMKEATKYIETNEQKTYKSVSFFKNNKTEFVSPYANFVTKTNNYCATNSMLLPIYVTSTTFIKTDEIVKIFDYEKYKDEFFEKSKQNAYTILPKNVTINEITQSVSNLSDRYIFQTYLKTTMEIKNEN